MFNIVGLLMMATRTKSFTMARLRCWCPNVPTGDGFESARCGISSAIYWTRDHVLARLNRDLELLKCYDPLH